MANIEKRREIEKKISKKVKHLIKNGFGKKNRQHNNISQIEKIYKIDNMLKV